MCIYLNITVFIKTNKRQRLVRRVERIKTASGGRHGDTDRLARKWVKIKVKHKKIKIST